MHLTAVLVLMLLASPLWAASAWYEGFEGPTPSWRPAGGDSHYQVFQQRRATDAAHTGRGSEYLQIQGFQGSQAWIGHDIGQPRVIEELRPTLWIKADRPGIQLAARVVLPRTLDSRSGKPIVTLLTGAGYTAVGRWQELAIEDLPKLLARQIWVLRSQFGPNVDGREAYVDSLLLNIYGGPGVTNVWIDDLDIAGHVPAMAVNLTPPRPETASSVAATAPRQPDRHVELTGSILLVDGRPMCPRAVQHRGEPLAALKRLGFNTVWLDRLAPPALLEEARAAGVWLVCAPPRPARIDTPDEAAAALVPIGPEYDSVLVWDLGDQLTAADVDVVNRWAAQVRTADRAGGRPMICSASESLRAYSRACQILLLDRRPLGTSLELSDYEIWLRQQPRLALPGTPFWATIQTQPSAALREQLRALDPTKPPPSTVSAAQVRLLVYAAIAAGSRGLVMLSDSPLTADDPETRQRALMLESLNLDLERLAPWGAAGTFVANAEPSNPNVTGTILRSDRARIVMPRWSSSGGQYVLGQAATTNLALVMPGAPESVSAYRLSPGRTDPLRAPRVSGGTRVVLDEFGLTDLILLSQDALVINSMMQRSEATAQREAQLQRDLAVREMHVVQDVTGQLATLAKPPPQSQQWLADAGRQLQQCEILLAGKNYSATSLAAARATRAMRLVERAWWDSITAGLPSPVASPATVSFETLPWQRSLSQRLAASRLVANLAVGGDFEDLDALMRAGWQNQQRTFEGVRTETELSAAAAHSGASGLRMAARAQPPDQGPAILESSPMWITSPPIPLQAGQTVCIQGWVRVPAPITGSVDGLLVADSLGGEPLALRIAHSPDWQRFVLYRTAGRSEPMSLSFVLTGLGEAHIDDVTVQVLQSNDIGTASRRWQQGGPQSFFQ